MLDLGLLDEANTTHRIPLDKLDFSPLESIDVDVEEHRKCLANLDTDTGLYIMGVFMALFFTDNELERAITSLQLDERLMRVR